MPLVRSEKKVLADAIWGDADPNDIVIVVIGTTGVGKSTFVDHLVRGAGINPTVEIGDDLTSCTVNLQPIPIPAQNLPILAQNLPDSLKKRGSRLVIVDTPGFDDTYTDDSVILKRIKSWLASSYKKDMKLGGVIYLHDISRPRVNNAARQNLKLVHELCGDAAVNSMVLGTTKWATVDPNVALKREVQLGSKFWGKISMCGAQTARFDNTSQSAWKMVEDLLNISIDAQILQIQEGLIELEKTIPTGNKNLKQLRHTLQELTTMRSAQRSGSQQYNARMKRK